MTQTNRPRSVASVDLALLGLIVIWGANFAIVKSALSEVAPLAFNALRLFGGSLVTLALTWVVERDLSIPRRDWGQLLVLGFLSSCLYQFLYIHGQARTGAGNASLILSTVPIFVALIGRVLNLEKLLLRCWIGIVLSFAGISLLILGGNSSLAMSSETVRGDLLVLGATITWALYTVLSKPLMQRSSALKATACMMVSTTPLMVLAAVPELRAMNWRGVSPQSWLGLTYSAVLAIGIGYVIWNVGVQRLGGTRTALYRYLTPLVTVIVSRIMLGETLQPLQGLGALAILLGIVVARYQVKA